MKEHLQSAKPLKDNWALSIAVPQATVDQTELLCNAGFLSVGCFSITFTEVLEDTSTTDFHPFQDACSNIQLTTRTSAILSQQQNVLSWRGQAMNFSQMVKKGESRGQKLKPRQQMFTLGEGAENKISEQDQAQQAQVAGYMSKSSMAEQVIRNICLTICGYQLQLFHQRKPQRDPHLDCFLPDQKFRPATRHLFCSVRSTSLYQLT